MEASQMLDVVHALYEEDVIPLWEMHIEAKDRVREAIYSLLYEQQYKFSATSPDGGQRPAPPATAGGEHVVKPYIPPTNPEDLMDILGPPLG